MSEEALWLSICGGVFLAALVQAATGIGFGLIAMPFLLLLLPGSDALLISIFLSLVMSVVLAMRTRQEADKRLLRALMLTSVLGLPVGLVASLSINTIGLKLLASIVVLSVALAIVWSPIRRSSHAVPRTPGFALYFGGFLGSAMGVCLAMPGPAVIGTLRSHAESDKTVRGTLFAFLVVSYAAAFALQLVFAKATAVSWRTGLILLAPMLLGIIVGNAISPRLSRRANRIGILLILFATGIALAANSLLEALQ